MSIKLIYGNNGGGKSLYSEDQDVDSIVLNSYISNWYNDQTHKISELEYISQEPRKEINILVKKLTSAKTSLSSIKGFKFNNFNTFLKSINFTKKEEWDQYVLVESKNYDDDLSIPELIDLHNFVSQHKDMLIELAQEDRELIMILSSLWKYEINDKYDSKIAQDFNNQIVFILKTIQEKLQAKGIDEKHFVNIEIKDLKRLFANIEEIPVLALNLIDEIKSKMIKSEEYVQIKKLEQQIENLKINAIKFVADKEYKLLDDNYAIEIDLGKSNYSEGQKTAKVLEILVKSLESTDKKIILDDFFEKLDVINQEKAIISIMNSSKEFEILTHDIKTVEIIQSTAQHAKFPISENKVLMNQTTNKPEIKETPLILTFQSLCSQIWESTDEADNSLNIFVKIFGRYIAKAGSLTGDNLMFFRTNKNSQSWELSANEILHYSDDIPFEKIKEKFLIDIESNIDSIQLLELLSQRIANETRSKRYGISFAKILAYIQELIKCLSEEKRYLDYVKEHGGSKEGIKSNIFYDDFWYGRKEIKPLHVDKPYRNQIVHQLDNSLLTIAA